MEQKSSSAPPSFSSCIIGVTNISSLVKNLEALFECSDSCTMRIVPKNNTIEISVTDAFETATFYIQIGVMKIIAPLDDLKCTCNIKEITRNLKNNKITPMKIIIVENTSICFEDANDANNIIVHAENIELDEDENYHVQEAKNDDLFTAIILQTADFSNIVINLCICNGFIHFKTDIVEKKLCFLSENEISKIEIQKKISIDVLPSFETIVIAKTLKILTHAFGPKSITMKIPKIPTFPLKFSLMADDKCSLNVIFFDQKEFIY
jgi:hypothetical protein